MADEASDVELLLAWRAGDASAGERLVGRYFLPIHRFVSAHVQGDVDDVTQRTFEACIAGRDRMRDDAAFRGYLFGIARNLVAKQFEQRRTRGTQVPISQAEPELLQSSPSRAFVRVEQQRLLLRAIADLPDDLRPTIERFYLDGRTLEQIATELGVAVGTVKSRLFRGRARLREAIAANAAPGPLRDATMIALEQAGASIGDEPEPG
jgi:RNA polymerase sigma factor (sigma-70 family)